METNELIEVLQGLADADIDAVHSYNQVLDDITDQIIRARLLAFRDHHLDHVAAISDELRSLGAECPQITKDLKDHVYQALAALRTAAGGMKGALKVLKTAEETTNRRYAQFVSEEVPERVKDLLRRHFSDEKIHLEYINENEKVI